ncbi:CHASE2 domain-containing protein [Pleionea sp. CnH1-48]|uniref:CHASE2 domain-containing protein n=1 Tax=Pleionea sp. CnH1-48 TaxID=2954494 RepID=UPI00209866C3|nr:CHASE2 domain-containing protein [Pleionea sp. CnH1-48]MCO7225503.1 CHASE2 domain-containing protein [Pleionea sp. CnH1-48]
MSKKRAFIIAISAGLLSVLLQLSPLAIRLDYTVMDNGLRWSAIRQKPLDDVVIVHIDDVSLANMGVGKWPWPRSVHASLIEGLADYQPKAIVFDIILSDQDIYRIDSDAYFYEVVSQYPNIYFAGVELNDNAHMRQFSLSDYAEVLSLTKNSQTAAEATATLALPWVVIPEAQQTYSWIKPPEKWNVGSINFTPDIDKVGRSYQLHRDLHGWQWLSLPALVASNLGAQLPQQSTIRLQWLGRQRIPFANVSYVHLFNDVHQPYSETTESLVKNKIIVIGATAAGLHDLRATPMSKNYPGTSILATAIDNLMSDRYLKELPRDWTLYGAFVLVFMLTYSALNATHYRQLVTRQWPVLILISISAVCLSLWLLTQSYILYVGFLLLNLWCWWVALTLWQGFLEYSRRRKTVNLFSRFMDPRVVHQLMGKNELELSTQTRSCQITVLFSDIRGFTSLSEKRQPQEVVSLLNDYFSLQVDTLFQFGGTLDKFIGDAVMAFWGAPIDDDKQADNAIKAAEKMVENLLTFRKQLPEDLQEFDIGIGLHTGEAVVGMIGAEKRYDYTAIGDSVNLASRIEGLTKNRARILISEQTLQACSQSLEVVKEGDFQVKGREEAVTLYRLAGDTL